MENHRVTNGLAPSERLEDRMDHLTGKTLPHALNQLAGRHDMFGQVVQHLEGKYIAAQHSGNSKDDVIREAKGYIATGLANVLKDIELAAANIDQLVAVQELSVDSLTSQVDMVQMRLQATKNQHAQSALDEMKVANGALTVSTAQPAVRQVAVQRIAPPKELPSSPLMDMEQRSHHASSLYNFNIDGSSNPSVRQLPPEPAGEECSAATGADEVSTAKDSTTSLRKRRVSMQLRLAKLQSFGLEGGK